MAFNLTGRIEKLEATAGAREDKPRKVIRLVANDGEEAEAYRQAEEMGLDMSLDSNDLLIVRLLVPSSRQQDIIPANSR